MKFAPILLSLVLSACALPDYPVPEQSPSFENFKVRDACAVDFAMPDADAHIVRDIIPGSDLSWRWTFQRPAVKERIGSSRDLTYVADFTLPRATFSATGPVTIAFTVNGQLLERVRYDSPGAHHFEKSVPPAWIEPHRDAIIAAEIDKVWISKTDGAHLGFIVSRLGLVEK
ncbi:MAG TPA: hypothetical protein VKX39_08570 [Bryobacteraceae bacterium]|jgi:hypothetical protein|nr:hypothetical protein [Bryobacteraceae bacterium]